MTHQYLSCGHPDITCTHTHMHILLPNPNTHSGGHFLTQIMQPVYLLLCQTDASQPQLNLAITCATDLQWRWGYEQCARGSYKHLPMLRSCKASLRWYGRMEKQIRVFRSKPFCLLLWIVFLYCIGEIRLILMQVYSVSWGENAYKIYTRIFIRV